MSRKELLKELDEEFQSMKKELKFNSTIDDLDKIFFIRDFILDKGYVSTRFSRMLCARMVETFNLWIGQMHSWMLPNPASMLEVSENKVFDEADRENIMNMMKIFMAFSSRNIVIGLTKDKPKEAEFIDNAVKIWNEHVSSLIDLSKKRNEYWVKEVEEIKKK